MTGDLLLLASFFIMFMWKMTNAKTRKNVVIGVSVILFLGSYAKVCVDDFLKENLDQQNVTNSSDIGDHQHENSPAEGVSFLYYSLGIYLLMRVFPQVETAFMYMCNVCRLIILYTGPFSVFIFFFVYAMIKSLVFPFEDDGEGLKVASHHQISPNAGVSDLVL